MDNFNLTLKHLYFIKNLGQGKFGSVSLVHNNKKIILLLKLLIKKLQTNKKY